MKTLISITLVTLFTFVPALTDGQSFAGTYTTNFPLTENPISEGGNWVGGQTAGNNLWGNVQTNGTMAYGVSEPSTYGDPTAILTGTWGANQTVQATAKINTTPTGTCCHEAEVRLRNTINSTNHTISGYEIYCSVNANNPYCHIASWGGPNGSWVNMEYNPPHIYLKNGDILKATVTGTNPVTITAYLNGTQIMTVQDTGNFTFSDGKKYGPWITGSPGIGFYDDHDSNWSYFGLSNFTASDGKTDITIFRPSSGIWYSLPSRTPESYVTVHWGMSGDVPIPADYDGDGKSDTAVWRPSTGYWYVLPSRTPNDYSSTQWGMTQDIPVPGDYDGDGIADIAVWRPSTGIWYMRLSGTPGSYTVKQWGIASDIPVSGDYDGDGKTDIAVWRPSSGVWYVLPSNNPNNYNSIQWGMNSDIPAPGDYDGDGKIDPTVFRSSSGFWYSIPSASPGYTSVPWGTSGDTPVPADYDGDGKTDIAVWRKSSATWYVLPSGSPTNYISKQWGLTDDIAVSSNIGVLLSNP